MLATQRRCLRGRGRNGSVLNWVLSGAEKPKPPFECHVIGVLRLLGLAACHLSSAYILVTPSAGHMGIRVPQISNYVASQISVRYPQHSRFNKLSRR